MPLRFISNVLVSIWENDFLLQEFLKPRLLCLYLVFEVKLTILLYLEQI